MKLAKEALEAYVKEGTILKAPEPLPSVFAVRAGCFVTLHESGELRGCIGTIEPVMDNLAEEIISNAIAAGTRDPRFRPVTKEELPALDYTVEVLGPLEEVMSVEELDPRNYGVVVQSAIRPYRKGVLLPDIEGVDSPEQQIRICRMKAGIATNEPVRLFRFKTEKYR